MTSMTAEPWVPCEACNLKMPLSQATPEPQSGGHLCAGCVRDLQAATSRRMDWDMYFLNIAHAVSLRADCTRRQVGAVIVDPQHRIIATGYNGAAAGAPGCMTAGACPRGRSDAPSYTAGNHDYSDCIAVHAEANALLYADGTRTRGATLYSTDEPCAGCTRLIEGAGIARVVCP